MPTLCFTTLHLNGQTNFHKIWYIYNANIGECCWLQARSRLYKTSALNDYVFKQKPILFKLDI